MTDHLQLIVSAIDGYQCLGQGSSVWVTGVHETRDANWIQLAVPGAAPRDFVLRLLPDATPSDALSTLRKTLGDTGLLLTA
jgi:hypothetical protein